MDAVKFAERQSRQFRETQRTRYQEVCTDPMNIARITKSKHADINVGEAGIIVSQTDQGAEIEFTKEFGNSKGAKETRTLWFQPGEFEAMQIDETPAK